MLSYFMLTSIFQSISILLIKCSKYILARRSKFEAPEDDEIRNKMV
jgi:hypothetical protein